MAVKIDDSCFGNKTANLPKYSKYQLVYFSGNSAGMGLYDGEDKAL